MSELRSSRRIVLNQDIQHAKIWEFAEREGWSYLGHVPRDPDRGVFYEARWQSSAGNTVHFIIDEFADTFYMVAQNSDEAEADRIAERMQQHLPTQSLEELAEEFDVSMYPAGWAAALLRLGVGAPKQPDAEVTSRIQQSIGHRAAAVRRAAVWAVRYAGWPELKGCLGQMLSEERDPDVLEQIRQAIAVFEQTGGAR